MHVVLIDFSSFCSPWVVLDIVLEHKYPPIGPSLSLFYLQNKGYKQLSFDPHDVLFIGWKNQSSQGISNCGSNSEQCLGSLTFSVFHFVQRKKEFLWFVTFCCPTYLGIYSKF